MMNSSRTACRRQSWSEWHYIMSSSSIHRTAAKDREASIAKMCRSVQFLMRDPIGSLCVEIFGVLGVFSLGVAACVGSDISILMDLRVPPSRGLWTSRSWGRSGHRNLKEILDIAILWRGFGYWKIFGYRSLCGYWKSYSTGATNTFD